MDLKDMGISLTPEDVENVNIDILRDMFMKSVFVLEAALFSQAGRESKRLENLRILNSKIEDELFSDKVFNTLDNNQRINLYTTNSRNMVNSLQFMNKLQANISSGMETIASLEDRNSAKISKNRKLLGEDEKADKNDIMVLLREAINEKLEEEK